MAKLPVPEVQFEVVRGPRRSTRRALWFSVFAVFVYVIVANETERRSTLAILCLLAAFTWPVLNTYFPFVDRNRGAGALDFRDRRAIDKYAALNYPLPPFRRTFVTFAVFWSAIAWGVNVQPTEEPIAWWQRVGAVLLTTALWPLLCRVQDLFTKPTDEPAVKDEARLATLLLGVTAVLLFIMWRG